MVRTDSLHPPGLDALTDVYHEFTSEVTDFGEHSHRARLDVLDRLLSAELGRLTRVAGNAGMPGAGAELAELLAGMPVYRLYPRPRAPLSAVDAHALDVAYRSARRSNRCDPERLATVVAALRDDDGESAAHSEFRERFQQVSGAAMAKGVEDTAFYRYVRLVALNEVDCDPERTTSIDEFHAACIRTAAEYPLTQLATTTHDSKRAEDARLRVALLAEMPERWSAAVGRLHAVAERHCGDEAPSPHAEYLFYQTLVAAHPIDAERAWAYMPKAVREAKEETSWLEPDAAYEAALERFVRQMVADPEVAGEIGTLVEAMTPHWQELSLSQTLIKLTAPGVPDIYQGSELWDLRLVDPDNRTPVDYDLRRRLLRDVSEGLHDRFMARLDEGLPKLRLIVVTLAVRARNDDAFANGSGYQPLPVQGSRSEHAVCFRRRRPDGESATATIAFRWPLLLDRTWDDTTVLLPAGPWRNALTGADVDGGKQRLDALLADAPVALLERA